MTYLILRRLAVVGAAMVVLLGGCASDGLSIDAAGSTSDDAEIGTGLDGPVMRHLEPLANEGEGAEVMGVVEIEGDCLYVGFDEGGERYPIVWPASTSWEPDTGQVLLANGESVGHGDSVYGGGGYRYVDDVEAAAGEAAADMARACVENQYGEIAVVNNQPDAIAAGGRPTDDNVSGVDSAGDPQVEGDWLIEDLIVNGDRVELDPSLTVTVTIEGERISGTAACNQYVGVIDWSAEAGFGRFVVSDLSSTKKACDAEAMETEQHILTALQMVDSYEAADGLYVGRQTPPPTNFHLVRLGG